MADKISNVRAITRDTAHDKWLDEQADPNRGDESSKKHTLDSEDGEKLLSKLLEWYDTEMLRQSPNRYQMALDHDFYDGLQWNEEDIAELMERGQAPVVYNDVKPVLDWIIGAEKRLRVDAKVLPRTDDDVDGADIKTKTMKYISDVNHTAYRTSEAFAEAAKCGMSWLEDAAQDLPGEERVYTGWETWRNVLYDSNAVQRDNSDSRYVFRWRYIDVDVAAAMFPDRRDVVEVSAVEQQLIGGDEDDELWYLGQRLKSDEISAWSSIGRRTFISDAGWVNNRRPRVKIIEAWYRVPITCQYCSGDVFDGERYDAKNPQMVRAQQEGAIVLYNRTQMEVYCSLLTRKGLLRKMKSPYRHKRFPLTPLWCYRRGRDKAPYGVVRNMRDIQESRNKRMSKAIFIINTNQIEGEEGAVDDWNTFREEANRPDGVLIRKKGREVSVRRDYGEIDSLMKYAEIDSVQMQKTGGVTDENLGRETNAKSGYAIERRQDQGSLTTAEIFDNLRLAIQISGQNRLSIAEQYMTEPKVIRVTGYKGKIDWVKINQPVIGQDGEVYFENDITATQADYIVDEQDFTASIRQALSEEMLGLLGKLPPEIAINLLDMVVEMFDFPDKEEFVARIRQINGMPDPTKDDPEQEAKQAAQEEALAAQAQQEMEAANLENEKTAAETAKLVAEAEKIRSEAAGESVAEPTGMSEQEAQQRLADIEKKVQENLKSMEENFRRKAEELRLQYEEKIAKQRAPEDKALIDAESREEAARIQADAQITIAREQRMANEAIDNAVQPLLDQIDALREQLDDIKKEHAQIAKEPSGGEKTSAAPAASSMVINIGGGGKSFTIEKGKDGNYTGKVTPEQQEMDV